MVGTSLLTFLAPLFAALAGAAIMRSSPAVQLLGCVVGFIIGMVVVRLLLPPSLQGEGGGE